MIVDRDELRLMLGALAGFCISNFAIFSSPLYIGGLIDGTGFDEAQAGLTNTVEIGAIAVVTLLLANWVDRLSLRLLAMIGASLVLLANLSSFIPDSFPPLLITRALAGVGAGFCLAASSALLSRAADPDRAMGFILALNTLIMVIALTLMGYAKARWMFGGFVGLFTIAVLLLFPLLRFVPKLPFSPTRDTNTNFDATRHHLPLGMLGITLILFFCVLEGFVWAFSERIGTSLGMADSGIGLVLSLAQVSGLIAAILAAVMGGRISRILPIFLGILLMGCSAFIIYHTTSQLVYSTALASFSFGFFVAFPYLVGACARLDPDGRWAARATATTLLGGAIAPFLAGNIIVASDYQALGNAGFFLAIFCLILALLFHRLLNRADLESETA